MYIGGSTPRTTTTSPPTATRRCGRTTTSSTAPATRPATSCSSRRSWPRRAATSIPTPGRSCSPTPGAKFAGPVAEHHDGFSMWNSRANEWNSVGRGPEARPGAAARRTPSGRKGLKFMAALHHAYHFNGYYDHVPAQSDATLQEALRPAGTAAENQLWYDKLKEVIDGYQPDIIWQDFDLNLVAGVLPAAVPRVLLQPGGRVEQGRRRHLQGRLQQPGRGLRLRARRPGRTADPVLAHRRQHLQLQLVLHRRHRLLLDPGRCCTR